MSTNVYLAGPMTGKPRQNHAAFDKYTEYLRGLGHTVFSPAEHDRKTFGGRWPRDLTKNELRKALGDDLKWICKKADAVAMLPGWERSYGARAEHATAVALGLEVYYL